MQNDLFFAVKLTKNAGIDKYKYSGYGIGFDTRKSFSSPNVGFSKNVIVFGADMSSSVYIDNKKRYLISWCSINCRKKSIQLILLEVERNFV